VGRKVIEKVITSLLAVTTGMLSVRGTVFGDALVMAVNGSDCC